MTPVDRLKAWISAAHINNAEAARRSGYDRGNFHRLLNGKLKPSLERAHQIDEMTGGAVPMSSWAGYEPVKAAA